MAKGSSSMRYCMLLTAIFYGLTIDAVVRGDEDGKDKSATKTADSLVKLNKQGTVLLDAVGKRVLLKTKIVQREAVLEFLCCLAQTREHESILSLDAKAATVHAGLLAIGAKPGKPVRFFPKFQPPTGQEIDIFVLWRDPQKKRHRVPARKWIRTSTRRFFALPMKKQPGDLTIPKKLELQYDDVAKELVWFGQMTKQQKEQLLLLSENKGYRRAIESFFERSQPRQITVPWVFAGSEFVKEEPYGKNYYLAEGGEVICVANFSQAMIDVATRSSAAAATLLYEAATDQIPPLGTEVTVELIPRAAEKRHSSKPAKTLRDNRTLLEK